MSDFSRFLSRQHREALQSFFGIDLSTFELRISALPAAFYRLTLAEGTTIHISGAARALDEDSRATLVAREIARLTRFGAPSCGTSGLAELAEQERQEAASERIADSFAASLGLRPDHPLTVCDTPRSHAMH